LNAISFLRQHALDDSRESVDITDQALFEALDFINWEGGGSVTLCFAQLFRILMGFLGVYLSSSAI